MSNWNSNVVINDSAVDEKYNQIAREMFNNYLKYEQLMKNDTKSNLEKPVKQQTEVKSTPKHQQGIPFIKEGSAKVLKKNHGPNPYTGIIFYKLLFSYLKS